MKREYRFNHARKALGISSRSKTQTGMLMSEFILAFGELLESLQTLATEANRDRLKYFLPLLAVYRDARLEAVRAAKQVQRAAPDPTEVVRFETLLRKSFILQELVALETLLNAPESFVEQDEKQDKGENTAESVKELLKKPAEWWAPDWLEEFFKVLLDVIDELLAAIRGKGKKK